MTFLSEKKKEDDEKIKVKKLITINAWLAHIYLYIYTHTVSPNVLGHPLLMKGLTTLVISMSTNLNV